jgi:uncharacterized coiled-coil protein SlyX
MLEEDRMTTVEDRLSRLEVIVAEHSATLGEFRGLMVGVDQKIDRLSQGLDRLAVSIERRFEGMERRFDHQDTKFSKFFLWVIMAQLTTLLAIVAGLFGIVTRLVA